MIKEQALKENKLFFYQTTFQETSRIRRPQEQAPGRLTIPDLPLGHGEALLTPSLRIAY